MPRMVPQTRPDSRAKNAAILTIAKRDPDSVREAVLEQAAEPFIAGIVRAVKGEAPWDKPQRWAFRLVAEIAKLVGVPSTQILAIIQREVGADPATAKAAVAAWQDAGTMTPEAKAELAEAWLAEYHGLPVGIMRDAILRTKAGRLEWRQANGDGPSAEDVGDGQD